MRLQFAIILTITLLLMASTHYYLYRNLLPLVKERKYGPRLLKLLLVSLALSVPLSLMLGRVTPWDVGRIVFFVPLVWLGTLTYPILFLFAKDLVVSVNKLFLKKSDLPDQSRRLFIQKSTGIATGAAILGSAGVGIANARVPQIVKVPMRFKNLPQSFNDFKIVQISDVHIGRPQTGAWLVGVVEKINSLNPDIVVITGDLVDGSVKYLGEEVRPLSSIKSNAGVYFITGNHEYYSGVEQWMEFLPTLGIKILRNESVTLNRGEKQIKLLGVDDYKAQGKAIGHGADLEKSLHHCKEEDFKILLAHQPNEIANAQKKGIDLQLSGHTHGGQLWPFGFVVRMIHPYVKGHYVVNDRTQLYVNQGTGCWGPPMRIGTISEITLITLNRA